MKRKFRPLFTSGECSWLVGIVTAKSYLLFPSSANKCYLKINIRAEQCHILLLAKCFPQKHLVSWHWHQSVGGESDLLSALSCVLENAPRHFFFRGTGGNSYCALVLCHGNRVGLLRGWHWFSQ